MSGMAVLGAVLAVVLFGATTQNAMPWGELHCIIN